MIQAVLVYIPSVLRWIEKLTQLDDMELLRVGGDLDAQKRLPR